MELIAQKSLRYAGRSLVAGDKFEASDRDARLLKAIGKAADAPVRTTHEDAGTSHDAGAHGYERQGRRTGYRTRQMKAADVEPAADEKTEEGTDDPGV